MTEARATRSPSFKIEKEEEEEEFPSAAVSVAGLWSEEEEEVEEKDEPPIGFAIAKGERNRGESTPPACCEAESGERTFSRVFEIGTGGGVFPASLRGDRMIGDGDGRGAEDGDRVACCTSELLGLTTVTGGRPSALLKSSGAHCDLQTPIVAHLREHWGCRVRARSSDMSLTLLPTSFKMSTASGKLSQASISAAQLLITPKQSSTRNRGAAPDGP